MSQDVSQNDKSEKGERIAKAMAHAGLCSRRDAEGLIAQGRVKLNGRKVDTPATFVSGSDQIEVDGTPLKRKNPTRLFMYHKPTGLVTTHKDELGRKTVFDMLPKDLPRLVSVGRLDLNSEGLLLMTTDGELSRYLEHPSTGWSRNYRVRVFGAIDEGKLASLKNGITVEGIKYGPIMVKIEKSSPTNSWLQVTLKEGKNREIRKVMGALGLEVSRLLRVSYGPFQLGQLPRGNIKEVHTKILKEQIPGFFKS